MTGLPLPNWNNESVITDGQTFMDSVVQLIDQSISTLDLEFYIFEPGEMAKSVMSALARAQQRGVKIRLLVDGVGAHNFFEDFDSDIEEIKMECKVYHPAPWHFANFRVPFAWLPSTMIQLFGNINNRNHRKVVICDKSKAIVGSFNISDVHLPKPIGEEWFDAAVQVEGDCVQFLVSAFEHAWEGWLGYHRSLSRWFGIKTYISHVKAERYFLLNHTLRLRRSVRDRLYKHLRSANNLIWISTPYFAPSWSFIRLLGNAVKRGVDVRLMVPRNNDVVFMYWVMKTYYSTLRRRGVRLFEYKPSVLHAKIAVVDDWIAVGSTNLNSRSLFHDLEANYLLQMSSTKHQLIQLLEAKFQKECDEIVNEQNVAWWERVLGRFVLLFKHWI